MVNNVLERNGLPERLSVDEVWECGGRVAEGDLPRVVGLSVPGCFAEYVIEYKGNAAVEYRVGSVSLS